MPLIDVGSKITWNVGNMSDDRLERELLRMLLQHKPISLMLQEVYDRKDVIHEVVMASGYKPYVPKGGASHCATLVHPRAKIDSKGQITLSWRRWVGRRVAGAKKHGMARKNEGVFVRYTYGYVKWIDMNVHLIPSHHIRLARVVARIQIRRLKGWFQKRSRVATLAGDFNHTLDSKQNLLQPLKKIAHGYTDKGGTFKKHKGRSGIDIFFFLKRQVKKYRLSISVKTLDGYSSDHKPVMVTIQRRA